MKNFPSFEKIFFIFQRKKYFHIIKFSHFQNLKNFFRTFFQNNFSPRFFFRPFYFILYFLSTRSELSNATNQSISGALPRGRQLQTCLNPWISTVFYLVFSCEPGLGVGIWTKFCQNLARSSTLSELI